MISRTYNFVNMAAPIELSTPDKLEYNFFPNNSGFCQFRVKANNDAHIALTSGPAESDPMVEIFIGGWGCQRSVIRFNRSKPDVAEVDTPGILNGGEFRGFWVRWQNGEISAGREGEGEAFISTRVQNFPINYIGFCTGWGSDGNWIVEPPYGGMSGSTCWVPASGGYVPPSAFPGGEDNGEPVYIIRANYQGGLIPGKLIASHGTSYVPWGGQENPVSDYEVLCDFRGTWVASSGGSIPPNAVPGGQSEEGEPLYIGRVVHEGSLQVGKVQASHNVCYIPYGGQELGFQDYEVLVS